MRIEAITLQRLCVPLTHPYRVALADIRHFDTIIVEIEAETGSRGLGEATVLTGYTQETISQSWGRACTLAERVVGFDTHSAKNVIIQSQRQTPFACTALGTAIEMTEGCTWLNSDTKLSVPLLGVACDIGCWMEAMVAARCLQTTSEMNGFLKPEHPLFVEPLRVKDSELLIPAGFQPRVDWQRVAACLVDKAVYRR